MMNLSEWIPRRDHSQVNKYACWRSSNFRVFLSLGGDIYSFHLEIARLSMSWEANELLQRRKRVDQRKRYGNKTS
jgi:hypothetical protein